MIATCQAIAVIVLHSKFYPRERHDLTRDHRLWLSVEAITPFVVSDKLIHNLDAGLWGQETSVDVLIFSRVAAKLCIAGEQSHTFDIPMHITLALVCASKNISVDLPLETKTRVKCRAAAVSFGPTPRNAIGPMPTWRSRHRLKAHRDNCFIVEMVHPMHKGSPGALRCCSGYRVGRFLESTPAKSRIPPMHEAFLANGNAVFLNSPQKV